MDQKPNLNFPSNPYLLTTEAVLTAVNSSKDGLSAKEAKERQEKFGFNELPNHKKLEILKLILSQFANAMVVLMMAAAGLSLFFNHLVDAILIFAIVLINAVMGFIQEFRAEQSIAALKQLLETKVEVKRDVKVHEIPQHEVTIGDVIVLQEGSKVPADARVLTIHNCLVSESVLTGESFPVTKTTGAIQNEVALADQTNMLLMGTTVVQGTVEAVVTAIGTDTEFGKIASNLREITNEKEHFSQKVSTLSKQMGTIAIISAVITFIVGYFIRGFSFAEISVFTIATLVSALPEGLPIILVIVLAVGAQRMAKKQAIIRKLSATETLGVVSVIITDKTGTLTQNIMTAKQMYLPGQPIIEIADTEDQKNNYAFSQAEKPLLVNDNPHLWKAVTIAGVCHQVRTSDEENVTFGTLLGDPTEKALYLLAHKAGFNDLQKSEKPVVIDDLPFQQQLRMRACLVDVENKRHMYLLGAPENILEKCDSILVKGKIEPITDQQKKEIEKNMAEFSADSLRVVALSSCYSDKEKINEKDIHTAKATFIGLVGLYDPPRPEIKSALQEARNAGIRVIMATGDHPETAAAIAKQVALVNKGDFAVMTEKEFREASDKELLQIVNTTNVFARLTPQSKLKVAEILQSQGHVVVMTGDGVNDAPALKKADVGIAMGISGTDVAREASKVVLADDNFATIIAAIKEGRTQFSNLRRSSFFLIMTNISESASLLIALTVGFPLPLLPIQILWLNVITGGLTDFALSLEPGHKDSMKFPPRSPKENILNLGILPLIISVTTVTTIISLAAFQYFLPQGVAAARTAIFIILSCSQLLTMLSLRSLRRSLFSLPFFGNKPVLIVFVISSGLLVAALTLPILRDNLHFGTLASIDILWLILASLAIFVTSEVVKKLTAVFYLKR